MKRLLLISLSLGLLCPLHAESYDLCVYGGTASGIVAAHAAARMGLDVVVIEPTSRIGGMTTGGLGQTDIGNKAVVKGLSLKFYRELGKHYGNLENWIFEPSAALAVMEDFAKSDRIEIHKNQHLVSVRKKGTAISKIVASDGNKTLKIRAKWFIDASYEGDLMAMAGISYRVGREDNSEYGETWNGSQLLTLHQFPDGVDPFVDPGNPSSGLLWGISDRKLKADGVGDTLVQAYNFRVCLTDVPENRIPIEKPDNYDPSMYELLLRVYAAQPDMRKINQYFIWTMMPNRKTDVNNRGAFSTDMIGMNYNYPEGSWEERQKIIKAHKDYTLGLLYFVGHDPRVPSELRDFVKKWGLPKDEYVDTDHWTPQLYIRECRRMVGEYVATQADCDNKVIAPEGVAYAAYTMDSHNTERIVVEKDGKYMVKNEGDAEIKGGLPYPISYRSLTPRRTECTNLLVPVCCSASHIAYGSIRMEPVFMCLGQASGIACALAAKKHLASVQDVDYREIVDVFDSDPYMDGSAPDLILDDTNAVIDGNWQKVVSTRGWGPTSYKCTGGNGSVTFTGTCRESGDYDIYNYTHFTRSEHINPITTFTLSDGRTLSLDASKVDLSTLGQTSSAWQPIGSIHLSKGETVSVKLLGTPGVVADAVMFVKR